MWGTPYEMGHAHGQLVAANAKKLYNQVFAYIDQQVRFSNSFFRLILAIRLNKRLSFFLNSFVILSPSMVLRQLWKWLITWPKATHLNTSSMSWRVCSSSCLFDADWLLGFADGSGIPYMDVVRLHMFPELIKAQCSMVGAWGPATSGTPTGMVTWSS